MAGPLNNQEDGTTEFLPRRPAPARHYAPPVPPDFTPPTSDPPAGSTDFTAFPATSPAASLDPSPPQPGLVSHEDSPIPQDSRACQIGILGPSDSGKTYLFKALTYRLESPDRYGVLAHYLKPDGVKLWQCSDNYTSQAHTTGCLWDLPEFNEDYKNWRVEHTRKPSWYYLCIPTRGGRRSDVKITFIDVPGEEYQKPLTQDEGKLNVRLWNSFRSTRVMVFCLPVWVAFPGALTSADWDKRQALWDGFSKALANYRQLRNDHQWKTSGSTKARIVLALTYSDDQRCGLADLQEKWIESYVKSHHDNLERLARSGGPPNYLAAARVVSDYIAWEFKQAADSDIRDLPGHLTLGGEKPWYIPVTAVSGTGLNGKMPQADPPIPAHVELPLLLALCDADNILM